MSGRFHDEPIHYWRGRVNEILYITQFQDAVDEELADQTANAILAERVLGRGVAEYVRAIGAALAQDGMIATQIRTPHSESDLRVFLDQVRERLGARSVADEDGEG